MPAATSFQQHANRSAAARRGAGRVTGSKEPEQLVRAHIAPSGDAGHAGRR